MSSFIHSTSRTHEYAAKGMECYGVYNLHPSKRELML
ncbi:hypothetical protein OTSSIDO_0376 [Orientia tsutsugamushi str. Sido]|nr:hypothetical protein OTSSIDO_0376 [Orientia tsutsugamushi str. Sido]